MATIRKRGQRWQVQVRRKGSFPVNRSFLKRSDATAWAREMETRADRNDLLTNFKALDRTTIGDLFKRFRDEVVPLTRSASVDTYRINAFLRHRVANLPLSAVTPQVFSAYRDERLKRVKPATVQCELAIIQRVFKAAIVDWDLPLRENPLTKVRKPRSALGRDRRLLEGEEERLRQAISERCRNPWIMGMFDLALETSCRRSELLAVRWADVDVEARTMLLRNTKNGRHRLIALSGRAITVLQALPRDTELVLPISAEAVKCAWRRLRKWAGCPDLRFHDLRHEAISRLVERHRFTLAEAALMSGHRDYRMLARYTHLTAVTALADRLKAVSSDEEDI